MLKLKKVWKWFPPKRILQVFVYSVTFSLLLAGFKVYATEKSGNNTNISAKSGKIQQDIANNVIRLHVVANSDSTKDQNAKLKVRDAIITSLQQSIAEIGDISEARTIISSQMPKIQATAQAALREYGSSSAVSVSLSNRYFPVKKYGDLSFPAGMYQALCVDIGAAQGHNWWCVLFPSLCFVDETTAFVPEESKEKLKKNLSSESYDSLKENTDSENTKTKEAKEEEPEIHSALLDWFTDTE